ncbi:PilZ domain-containing protein [Sulfurimonas sp.]
MKIEQNCNRKSHRLNIPIQVIINNVTSPVLDWSTKGLKIRYEGKDISLEDELLVSIILPTGSSAIVLEATVIVRNIIDDTYGLEIIKLSDKNSRVLRHYATLAIDGNRNQIDDLSSDLFMADIKTPITESILLSDKESKEVHKSFFRRSFSYVLIGVLFLIVVCLTLMYNYLILYKGIGLISGNSQNYKAPYDGQIKDVYVSAHQQINKGQLLFEMQDKDEKALLVTLIKQKKVLKKERLKSQNRLKLYQNSLKTRDKEKRKITKAEQKRLRASFNVQKETYARAKHLYAQKLITFEKYSGIQNQYLRFMSEYKNSVLNQNSTNSEILLVEQQILKVQDQIIFVSREINQENTEIQKISLNILTLKQKVQNAIVLAKEDAKVYNIFHKKGEEVKYSDAILTLEIKTKPYLLTKMTTDKISAIHIGGRCLLYSNRLHKSFYGKIVGLGYSVTESLTSNTTAISQNEIPIKIEFDNNDINFHLNEYLEVYMLNDSMLSKTILEIMPQGMIIL